MDNLGASHHVIKSIATSHYGFARVPPRLLSRYNTVVLIPHMMRSPTSVATNTPLARAPLRKAPRPERDASEKKF